MASSDTESSIPINKNRSLVVPLGLAASAALALLGAGWKANEFMTEVRQQSVATRESVEALRSEMKATAVYRWTTADMERWAYLLERTNRELKLNVPDVRDVRPRPGS